MQKVLPSLRSSRKCHVSPFFLPIRTYICGVQWLEQILDRKETRGIYLILQQLLSNSISCPSFFLFVFLPLCYKADIVPCDLVTNTHYESENEITKNSVVIQKWHDWLKNYRSLSVSSALRFAINNSLPD